MEGVPAAFSVLSIFAIERALLRTVGPHCRVSFFPKSRRAVFAFLHDLVMAALSFVLALYLRVGDEMLTILEPKLIVLYGVAFTLIAGGVFLVTGLYRGIWRYASLPDLFNIARAAALTGLIFLPVMFLFTRLDTLPRSFLLINWLVLVALLGGPRLVLSPVQGPPPGSSVRARPRRQRSGSADQHEGRRRYVHPRVRARPLMRCTGWSACCPIRRRGSAGRYTGCRFSGTIDSLEKIVADLDRRGRRPHKLVITTQGLAGDRGAPPARSRRRAWRSRSRGCRGLPNFIRP